MRAIRPRNAGASHWLSHASQMAPAMLSGLKLYACPRAADAVLRVTARPETHNIQLTGFWGTRLTRTPPATTSDSPDAAASAFTSGSLPLGWTTMTKPITMI